MATYNDLENLPELDNLTDLNNVTYQLADRYARETLVNKQDSLTAGDNIVIDGGRISAVHQTDIDDTITSTARTWSSSKLSGNFYTQEQINELLQSQVTQTQEILNVGGSNLIPYPYTDTTKTENGITFTDNGDRSITINGTATGPSYSSTTFVLVGTASADSPFTTPLTHKYRVEFVDTEIPGLYLGFQIYEDHDNNITAAITETRACHKWSEPLVVSLDPAPTRLYIAVRGGTTLNNVTVTPGLFDLDDTSNVSIQAELTAGPGITINSNTISAKIDSDTIKFNSNSQIAVASEVMSEIDSLSLHDSQHTSQLTSLSTSMSELASTASSLSIENSQQNSSLTSLSTATSELASEVAGKQDSLTAGSGISIVSNVISATGGGGGSSSGGLSVIHTYTPGVNVTIRSALMQFYDSLAALTQDQYASCVLKLGTIRSTYVEGLVYTPTLLLRLGQASLDTSSNKIFDFYGFVLTNNNKTGVTYSRSYSAIIKSDTADMHRVIYMSNGTDSGSVYNVGFSYNSTGTGNNISTETANTTFNGTWTLYA